jgi:uncharacterized protein (DUF362 family)
MTGSLMEIHPVLKDRNAVLIVRQAVPHAPAWQDYERCAYEALELMQLNLQGAKVVLKPNATSGEHFADAELGVGTHPAFIAGMANYLKQHGAKRGGIYVVEDPRDSDDDEPRHWRKTGFLEVAAQTGIKLRCPTSFTCVRREVPHPLVHKTRYVSRMAVDPATVLINVPKLKTHNLSITTLCMKNLMGLDRVFERHYCGQAYRDMPIEWQKDQKTKNQWMTREMHERWQLGLAQRLADLSQVIVPQLNVVEGIVGRDGTGFNRGNNYPYGLVAAGVNVVAVDSVVSYLMGYDPCQLIYLQVAREAGLGCNDLSQLKVYTAEQGEIVPVKDVERLRLEPPMKVTRDIAEE